jgi:hypothetical protein
MKLPRRPYLCSVRHRWRPHERIFWLERCSRCKAERHAPRYRWGRAV